MRIPEDVITMVKAQTDIVEIISQYVDLKKSGANYLGLCPFHSEKTPSFTVSGEKQFFKCFGCGEGGDAISFVMKREQLSYPEAIRRLAEQKGIEIQGSREETERAQRRETLYGLNQLAMQYYYKLLLTEDRPKAYLENRSIGYKAINHFLLGYAPDKWDGLLTHLTQAGASIEDALEVGLLAKSEKGKVYDRFRNRLMFPILDYRNRVIAFGGRALGEDRAKYLNSKESVVFHKGDHLYGLQNIARDGQKDPILLVEGYMDTIQLFQFGFKRTVASLGTALTDNQAKILKRYGGKIFLLYDGDAAGNRATLRAVEVFSKIGIEAKIISLEGGLDPDDFLRANGAEAMQLAIKNAYTPTAHFLQQSMKKHDLSVTEERVAFLDEAVSILTGIDRAYERDEYIRSIAMQIGVSEASLQEEVNRKLGQPNKIGYKQDSAKSPVEQKPAPTTRATRARKQLWVGMMAHAMRGKAAYDALTPYFTASFLTEEWITRIGDWVKACYEKESASLDAAQLREAFSYDRGMDGPIEAIVRLHQDQATQNAKAVRELYAALNHAVLSDEKAELLVEISLLSGEDDPARQELLIEKMRRLGEINRILTSGV